MDNSYLLENRRHHELFEKLDLNETLSHVAAWKLIAKLMTRNSGAFLPVSGYYPTGSPLIFLYHLATGDKLGINEGPRGSVHRMARDHTQKCPVCDALPFQDSRIKVSELLVDKFLDQIAENLEACLEIRTSAERNPAAGLGALLIRELVEYTVGWQKPLRATGVFYDWSSFNPADLEGFPSLERLASLPPFQDSEDDRFEEEYRDLLGPMFLIQQGHSPAQLVIDLREGEVHLKHGGSLQILYETRLDKDLETLAAELASDSFED